MYTPINLVLLSWTLRTSYTYWSKVDVGVSIIYSSNSFPVSSPLSMCMHDIISRETNSTYQSGAGRRVMVRPKFRPSILELRFELWPRFSSLSAGSCFPVLPEKSFPPVFLVQLSEESVRESQSEDESLPSRVLWRVCVYTCVYAMPIGSATIETPFMQTTHSYNWVN